MGWIKRDNIQIKQILLKMLLVAMLPVVTTNNRLIANTGLVHHHHLSIQCENQPAAANDREKETEKVFEM